MMKTMMTMMSDEVKIEGEAGGGFPIEEIEVIENEEEEDKDDDGGRRRLDPFFLNVKKSIS